MSSFPQKHYKAYMKRRQYGPYTGNTLVEMLMKNTYIGLIRQSFTMNHFKDVARAKWNHGQRGKGYQKNSAHQIRES